MTRPARWTMSVFDRAMAVNLRAPALLAERFAAQADPQRDNCIINLLDQKLWNINPDFYSYTHQQGRAARRHRHDGPRLRAQQSGQRHRAGIAAAEL